MKRVQIQVDRGRPSQQRRANAPVTLKDVAAEAGVSLQTVSFVVNKKGSVSPEVRHRVQQIADRMGYLPNKSAKAMRTGRSQTLGLIIDDLSHPYWVEYVQAAERAAAARGYAVLLVDAHDSTDETMGRIEALRMHPVDGVITTLYSPAIARLKLPMVVISGAVRGRDSVVSDDVNGGRVLAEHLLELGHRTYGLITSPRKVGVPTRRRGFLDRLPPDATVAWELGTDRYEALTQEVIPALRRKEATAIVCSNDVVAVAVLRALHALGIAVPAEVSVVGYDDISWAGIVYPRLTTIRQPFVEAARAALDLLVTRIERPTRRARHVLLGVSLVRRESTGRVSGAT